VTVQENFIAYCRCREVIKLYRFLLSPYNLIGICNNLQNYTFLSPAEIVGSRKFILGGRTITHVENIPSYMNFYAIMCKL
jgi:hypothetical protein